MINSTMIPGVSQNDAELVAASLTGSRDAFGHIVSRYQSLICSLAYSATGSLSQSEDLAQDTFVTAWKQLRDLREPEKLRSWLCGIARNIINNFLRKEGREPSHRAEPLEEIVEGASPEPLPVETTISKEEAALLWRSLEKIPETYREPLVLFYREHQSIESVAAHLDLTEDTVKQRLSRGRKLLQEQFLNFVEGALAQTNPGPRFTLSVVSALPALALSTKAAVLGAAAKSGAAKSIGFLGALGSVLSPLLAIVANYSSYRLSLNEADSDQERRYIKKFFRTSLLGATIVTAILTVPLFVRFDGLVNRGEFWLLLVSIFIVVYFLFLGVLAFTTLKPRKRHLAKVLAEKHAGEYPPPAFEYRSRATAFGWPLVHVRIGDRFDVLRGPVKAWIAVGSSHAVGLFFASGGIAVAPISFGGIAIGLLPFGAIAVGIFSLGAMAIGVWGYGAAALGWQICCGSGAAWHSALGGIVAARDFALGAVAHATHVNNDIARRFFEQDSFSQFSQWLSNHSVLVMLLWVIPVSLQARVIGRAQRRRAQTNS